MWKVADKFEKIRKLDEVTLCRYNFAHRSTAAVRPPPTERASETDLQTIFSASLMNYYVVIRQCEGYEAKIDFLGV